MRKNGVIGYLSVFYGKIADKINLKRLQFLMEHSVSPVQRDQRHQAGLVTHSSAELGFLLPPLPGFRD